MMDYTAIAVAAIALVGTVINFFAARRKTSAETAHVMAAKDKTIAETADTLTDISVDLAKQLGAQVAELKAQIKELSDRVAELERENHEWQDRYNSLMLGASKLVGQVIALGHTPDYVPPGINVRGVGGNDLEGKRYRL